MADDLEWHNWRRKGIGGSDIGALLGLSSFASPWSLAADKLGLLPPSPQTQRQSVGHRMEPVLAQFVAEDLGLTVVGEQTWSTWREWDVARATVDGFLAPPSDDGYDLADISTTWEAKTDGRRGWDEIPASILAQVQWGMGVTGMTSSVITVMFSGWRIEHHHLEFNSDDFAYMIERAREFWADIEAGQMPAVDGSEATARALAEVWPAHMPGERKALDDLIDAAVRRGDLKDEAKRISDELAEIDNQIKAAIGDAEIGTLAGLDAYTLRTQQGRKSTCTECGHTSQGEPFRVLRPINRKAA